GAVLGQALRTGRAGEHAREVEHADAGKRPFRRSWSFRRRIADSGDLDKRLRSYCLGLRVPRPVCRGAHETGAAAGGVDRILERLAGPDTRLFLRLSSIRRRLQHLERRIAMIREIAVSSDPAVS